ncbi:MAG: 30S ribosome-binding factor RbfA [Deltaproteobacteria bacterium]|nr:30S ribosome-binding factor RbfA [Deltaproteobacteria bacterium]
MKKAKRGRSPGSRPIQVGEQIRELLSMMLQRGDLKDPRLQKASMLTLTEVRVTKDLSLAKALVSIYPEEKVVVDAVMAGLASGKKEIQRAIGQELSLRIVPNVEFLYDDSAINGARIEKVLREIRDGIPAADDGDQKP